MQNNQIKSPIEDAERKDSVLLSVVVPVSRMEDYEFEIQSWITCSVKMGIHIILVHDLSVASSGDFLKDLAIKFPDLVTYCEGNFGNPGAARNRGLTEVRGAWVSFWDADDTPIPDQFIEMVRKANAEGLDAAVGLYEERDFITNEIISQPPHFKNSLFTSYQIARRPGIWRMSFNWSLACENRFPNRDMGEDQIYVILSRISFFRTLFFDEVVYRYSRNFPGQLTQGINRYLSLQELFEQDMREVIFYARKSNLVSKIIIMRIWMSLLRHGDRKKQLSNFRLLIAYFLRIPSLCRSSKVD